MRILISTGGTGGHLYPALALADDIKEREPETKFLFVGTKHRLESQVVPQRGYDYRGIHVLGLAGHPLQKAKAMMVFIRSLAISKKIIQEFKPDLVIGFGGYVSASVVYSATRMHIKTMIHEQNSIIGLTNKMLMKYVDAIVCCYEKAYEAFPKEKTYLLGNPRASVVVKAPKKDIYETYHLDRQKRIVLMVMGSLGSSTINQMMKDTLALFKDADYQILFVTGKHQEHDWLSSKDMPACFHTAEYIEDMPSLLRKVSLIVTRAGATTLAEITALGCPSLIIPSPYVASNHQEYNARELERKKAAVVILEKDLTPKKLVDTINHLLQDEETLKNMALQARQLGKPDACLDIYQLIKKIMKE